MGIKIKRSSILFYFKNEVFYLSDDGIIKKCFVKEWNYHNGPMYEYICKKAGMNNCRESRSPFEYFSGFVGKNVSELISDIEKSVERSRKAKNRKEEKDKRMENFVTITNGNGKIVIGVDCKGIDFFGTGFSAFLIFDSSSSFYEQLNFIKKYKTECKNFLIEELKRCKNQKVRDLIPFCKISEIVVTRRNEACFKFELKDGLEKLIKEEQ